MLRSARGQALDFRILGPLEARDGERVLRIRGRKQRALLALLLVNESRTLALSRIVDELWGENAPESAQKMVQIYVSQLRKLLPEGTLRTRPPGYALDLGGHDLDLRRFELVRVDGHSALEQGRFADASALFEAALGLWRGPALAEFQEPFAELEARRLEELRLVCLEGWAETELSLGRHARLVAELEASLRREPHRERLRGQLMLALYRCGRQAEALETYQTFRRMLDEELGIEPSARLRDLERRILQQDESLNPAAPQLDRRVRGRETVRPALGESPAGRQRELDQLERLLAEADEAVRHLVFLTGEAGIGKTTIVESFIATSCAPRGVLVAQGQCVEHRGAGEPYLPVLDALGRLARDPRGSRVVDVLARAAPTWLAQMPWLVSDERLEALERRLAGGTRERMLRELLEALDETSAEETLVLVLEDLHWSDASTVDFLDAFARRRGEARLLVLGTYRRDEAAAREHPVHQLERSLRGRGLCAEIAVGALSEEALDTYLESRFACPSPPGLGQLLRARTAGNPLFVRTLLDSWLQRGLLEQHEDELVGELEVLAADIPESVRQLIEQTLQQLDPHDRELLRAASVVGKEFSTAAVSSGFEGDEREEDIEASCEALIEDGRFINPAGELSWPDGTISRRYVFSHDLQQEVLYAGLPPRRRARLHRQIGERLELAYRDRRGEVAAELATHFLRSHDSDRAVSSLHLAAEQALRRGGHHEAVEHLAAALAELDRLPGSPERAEQELRLRITLGNALITARGYAAPETKATYARARALAGELGDAAAHSLPVLYGLWNNELVAGNHASALELAEAFLEIAERHDDDAVVVAHRAVAWPLLFLGRFNEARAHLQKTVDLYESDRHRALLRLYGEDPGVTGRSALALCLWFLGFVDTARETSASAVETARALEHPLSLAYVLFIDAKIAQLGGEPAVAGAAADAACGVAGEYGITLFESWATVVRGHAACCEGDVAGGTETICDGLRGAAATGSAVMQPYLLSLLSEAHAQAEQLDDALVALDDALALAEKNDERYFQAELHRLQGELHVRRADEPGAARAFKRARELAHAQETLSLELRAVTSTARLLIAQEKRAEAKALLSDAHGRLSEGFQTPDLQAASQLLEQL